MLKVIWVFWGTVGCALLAITVYANNSRKPRRFQTVPAVIVFVAIGCNISHEGKILIDRGCAREFAAIVDPQHVTMTRSLPSRE